MEAYKWPTPADEHQSIDQPIYRLTDHALSITVDHGQLCLSGRVTHVGLGLELWSVILGPIESILVHHGRSYLTTLDHRTSPYFQCLTSMPDQSPILA